MRVGGSGDEPDAAPGQLIGLRGRDELLEVPLDALAQRRPEVDGRAEEREVLRDALARRVVDELAGVERDADAGGYFVKPNLLIDRDASIMLYNPAMDISDLVTKAMDKDKSTVAPFDRATLPAQPVPTAAGR